jgi:hypothetical protein
MWSPPGLHKSMWSPGGVHMESVGEGKVLEYGMAFASHDTMGLV